MRPCPFAKGQAARPAERFKATVVFHGSFAPFHPGHLEALACAVRQLRRNGISAVKVVIGFTAEKQIIKKVPSARLLGHFIMWSCAPVWRLRWLRMMLTRSLQW
eukprot:5099467-Amphidinium_carterae.1